MDAYTLMVASSLLAAICCVSLYLLYRASSAHRSLLDWSAASLLFFLNSLIGIAVSRADVTGILMPALANALLFVAHGALLMGLRRHLGLPPGWAWLALLGVSVAAAHALPWLQAGVVQRLTLLWPLMMVLNLGTALMLWRSPGFGLRSPLMPLAGLLVLNAAQTGLRLALVLSGQASGLRLLGSDFLQSSGQLAQLVFILLSAMGCAFVVIRAQALQLREVSETDPMTGWRNRRGLAPALAAAQAHSERLGAPFALVIFDIDHFKSINDRHGHAVGDQAIVHVTRVVAEELRDYDGRYRIGGEEFLVWLPPDSAPHARAIAERLRQRVAAQPGPAALAITVSVGAAQLRVGAEAWEDTLRRADEALYAAKQGGRNRALLHEELALPQLQVMGS